MVRNLKYYNSLGKLDISLNKTNYFSYRITLKFSLLKIDRDMTFSTIIFFVTTLLLLTSVQATLSITNPTGSTTWTAGKPVISLLLFLLSCGRHCHTTLC